MRLVLIAGLACAFAAPALAQTLPDEATLATARRLVAATHFAERNLPPPDVNAIVQSAIVDCMARQADKPAKQTDCDADQRRVEVIARKSLQTYPARKARSLETAACIYARHFSRDDMESAVQFYQSDAGQHLFADTDAVAKEFRAAQFEEMAKMAADPPLLPVVRNPK